MVSEFGYVLIRVLEAEGLSCYELGEASALGAPTISKLVSGKRRPTERHVLRILAALRLSPEDLELANELLSIADKDIITTPRRRGARDAP